MMDLITETDITIKQENANKLYRVALLVEVYADNKKALKKLLQIVVAEKKYFKNLYFPLDEEFSDEISAWLEEIIAIIKKFRRSKDVGGYNKAKEKLRELMLKLQKELDFESRMTEGLRGVLQTAKETAHAFKEEVGEKLGQVRNLWGKKENDSK